MALFKAELATDRRDRSGMLADRSDDFGVDLRSRGSAAILFDGDGFEVGRVDAVRDEAEMVDRQPFGDGAEVLLVHRAMRRDASATELNFAVARLGRRGLNKDPARRLVAAVFDTPQIGCDRLPSSELASVPPDEPHVLPGRMAVFGEGLGCERCCPSAAALAEAAGIGRLNQGELCAPVPMPVDEWPLLAPDVVAGRLGVAPTVDTAATSAKHQRIIGTETCFG